MALAVRAHASHRAPWGCARSPRCIFPLNSSELHSLFALVAFVFFNLQAVASGTVLTGPMKLVSVLAGIVGIIFVVLMIAGDGGNVAVFGAIGHGGTERMIVYPVMLWMLALGGYLMAADSSAASLERGGN